MVAEAKSEIAVVRVRGVTGVSKPIADTLMMLNLHRKNYCTIVPATPSYVGMIKKVKDFVTFGPIDDEVKKQLINTCGEPSPEDPKQLKPFFRLSPPRGGFEKKGIKVSFAAGGALGDRGSNINVLLQKMIQK